MNEFNEGNLVYPVTQLRHLEPVTLIGQSEESIPCCSKHTAIMRHTNRTVCWSQRPARSRRPTLMSYNVHMMQRHTCAHNEDEQHCPQWPFWTNFTLLIVLFFLFLVFYCMQTHGRVKENKIKKKCNKIMFFFGCSQIKINKKWQK